MPVRLDEPKRVALRELAPGVPLREFLLGLPDQMVESEFDAIAPVLVRIARLGPSPG